MPHGANSACMRMQRESTPGVSELFYFCKNSLARPKYSIIQHYSDDDYVGIFNFDPRGANIICNQYELDKLEKSKCRKVGIKKIKKKYQLGKTLIQTINLTKSKKSQYENIYKQKSVFSYPESVEEIGIEKCFVHITSKQTITIGYDVNDYMSLSMCLLQMEENFKTNKQLFLKLLR